MMNRVAVSIIDVFEDLLERHNIVIPDEDRPDDNNTPIYGCTYSDLVDDVSALIQDGYGCVKDEIIEYLLDSLECEHMGMRAAAVSDIKERFGLEY